MTHDDDREKYLYLDCVESGGEGIEEVKAQDFFLKTSWE